MTNLSNWQAMETTPLDVVVKKVSSKSGCRRGTQTIVDTKCCVAGNFLQAFHMSKKKLYCFPSEQLFTAYASMGGAQGVSNAQALHHEIDNNIAP